MAGAPAEEVVLVSRGGFVRETHEVPGGIANVAITPGGLVINNQPASNFHHWKEIAVKAQHLVVAAVLGFIAIKTANGRRRLRAARKHNA